jgi:hypothetical protein
VLDQVQADHEAYRQPRPADALAIERAESGGKAVPVDQASQTRQRMAAIDEVHQRRAEELGLLGRRRLGLHRRSPARRRLERITPPDRLQQGREFAKFWLVLRRRLAILNTSASRNPAESRGLPRCSRATRYLFGHAPGTGGLQGRERDAELLVLIQAAIRAGVLFDSEVPARAWGLGEPAPPEILT